MKEIGETAQAPAAAEEVTCTPDGRRKGMVVVLSSNQMGQGDEVLGKLLMKGFVFALTQQDMLPETILYTTAAHSYPVKALIIWKILRLRGTGCGNPYLRYLFKSLWNS